ncbi:FAD/NAD(P)-binding protein [Sphingorhabdus sp. YGSMI21]|uniref:FAD/NAD(P)-binding protein n=1 Tax=Sphingorhabdus sp. YGSMI21 TaxID=2077182 RepID=UPI000F4E8634|nr:FAD/NAD(P)-binding protein [Sphingorhabdus sp. YGSMI21]
MREIGIVGSGPMAIYLLKHLASGDEPLSISIFEASSTAGMGMPYDPALNADYMLCNAFSREIPAPVRPLVDWLKDRPARELGEWELSAHDLTARAFYPRVLIGEYLHSQFGDLCEKARRAGHRVAVRTQCRVTDIEAGDAGKATIFYDNGKSAKKQQFDEVVIASGHNWPNAPDIDGVTLVSPWPYTNITGLEQDNIGILGSSLSAIDIVVAIGHARGAFDENGDGIRWLPDDEGCGLQVTMVSHMGIMPEGDFYYPFPYEPLTCLTPEAIAQEMAQGDDGLLDRVFALLCEELDAADPDYLASLPDSARSVEGFAPAYFARRRDVGGLRAVKRDLAGARETMRRKETIPHRYALLRGHEAFDRILRQLPEKQYDRFLDHLMPVFADCYAAVPHLSLARIIALHDAGVLQLVATEDGAEFSSDEAGQIIVETENGTAAFDVMVDARGQSPASLTDLPFPRLVKALHAPEKPVLKPFALKLEGPQASPVHCLALPQLLERHPFSQGLVECSRLARCVADDILGRPPARG